MISVAVVLDLSYPPDEALFLIQNTVCIVSSYTILFALPFSIIPQPNPGVPVPVRFNIKPLKILEVVSGMVGIPLEEKTI